MRKLISLITLFSFSIQAATITDDKLTVGKKASASAKEIVFDTNDGAANKKLSVDKITKKLSITSDEAIVGDGTASDKALTFNRGGANAQVKWNEVTDKLQFSNDGTTFKDLGTGGGGGGSTGVNVLTNDSFEDAVGGVLTDWSNTGGTLTQVSYTNSVEGDAKYFQFVATGAGQYFEMSKVVPTNFNGSGCQVDFKKLNIATADLFKVEALDGSNNVLATGNVKVSSWVKFPTLSFVCPTAGATFKIRVTSLAAGTLQGDKAYLGSNQNLVYSSQAKLVGTITWPKTTACNWVYTSISSFANPVADSDCPNPTTTGGLSAPGTKIPAFIINNRQAGDYYITTTGIAQVNGGNANQHGLRFSNGSISTSQYPIYVGPSSLSIGSFNGYFSSPINAASDLWQVQAYTNGTDTVSVDVSSSDFQISVWFYPSSSEIAVSPEQSSWFIDANIGGANPATTNTSSYTPFENASLDLALNTGSASAEIPCSLTNASTGLTCSVGNEQVGVAFIPPYAGTFEACLYAGYATSGAVSASTQWVETANNSQTILQEGKTRIFSDSAGAASGSPLTNCGIFSFNDTSKRTLRFSYEANSTVLALYADRSATYGQRDIHIIVRPILSAFNRPILTGDQVTTPSLKDYKIYMANATCSSSSSVSFPAGSPSWLSLGNFSGNGTAGTCTVTFSGLNSIPFCSTGAANGNKILGFLPGSSTSGSQACYSGGGNCGSETLQVTCIAK